MRSINFISTIVIAGLICCSLSQGQSMERSNNTGLSFQIKEETLPSGDVKCNMLWLTDPDQCYCRSFSTSLISGEEAKAELVPFVSGNLIIHKRLLSGEISDLSLGKVEAGRRYALWIRADQSRGNPWYNELWYSINGMDSNHIWYYIYEAAFPQYFKHNIAANQT